MKTHKFKLKGMNPLLNMFLASARIYLNHLKEINKEMYATQENLEKSTTNAEIMQLLELEKSLIFFSTSLRSNQLILERMSKYRGIAKVYENRELCEDVMQENKQAISMTKIYSIVLTTMMDAFGTVVSNNLNRVMRALTSVTIILIIPTLVASVYGMNVDLPFQNHPQAFWIVIIISFIFSICGIIFFWRKELF